MEEFLLASRSPRRVELLRGLGLAFGCVAADLPETPRARQSPLDFACEMALAKARAGQRSAERGLPVMGADTDVAIDGCILGKPRDADDALRMLALLSNRVHEVTSAVAVVRETREELRWTVTQVEFGPIELDDAQACWRSGEPADKAGAYAIQGYAGRWIKAIRGSYSGVVGLPLFETLELLKLFGIRPR